MSRLGQRLIRTDEERDWTLDMLERTARPSQAGGLCVVALLVLSALGAHRPIALVPAAWYCAGYVLAANAGARSRSPLPLLGAILNGQAMLAVHIWLVDGALGFRPALLLVAIAGGAIAFPARVATGLGVYTGVLTAGLILARNPAAVAEDPTLLAAPLTLVAVLLTFVFVATRAMTDHRRAAVIDPLTGMLNRAALASRAPELEAQARLTMRPVAVIVLDIDHFKTVNDTHGHTTGDRVLSEVAYRLRKGLRAFELGYRLGGEEFVILLPDTDHRAGLKTALRLVEAIRDLPCAGIPVTVSAGVAAAPSGTFVYAEVMAAADARLYEAKRTGRDRVCGEPMATVAQAAAT